jgi:hypothetical protein
MRYPQHSLGVLWRSRRWRYLLNLIDHLPADSHFMEAVSLDEEHARAMVKMSEGMDKKPYAPPMSQWSMTANLLAVLIDEVRALRHITLAVNSKQKPQPPNLYPRPQTAFDKVRLQEREAKHRALVARMLPHKSK